MIIKTWCRWFPVVGREHRLREKNVQNAFHAVLEQQSSLRFTVHDICQRLQKNDFNNHSKLLIANSCCTYFATGTNCDVEHFLIKQRFSFTREKVVCKSKTLDALAHQIIKPTNKTSSLHERRTENSFQRSSVPNCFCWFASKWTKSILERVIARSPSKMPCREENVPGREEKTCPKPYHFRHEVVYRVQKPRF